MFKKHSEFYQNFKVKEKINQDWIGTIFFFSLFINMRITIPIFLENKELGRPL
jgi:hypothetical protein